MVHQYNMINKYMDIEADKDIPFTFRNLCQKGNIIF